MFGTPYYIYNIGNKKKKEKTSRFETPFLAVRDPISRDSRGHSLQSFFANNHIAQITQE